MLLDFVVVLVVNIWLLVVFGYCCEFGCLSSGLLVFGVVVVRLLLLYCCAFVLL